MLWYSTPWTATPISNDPLWLTLFVEGVNNHCDEWGGAESRGNGARPVEWMIMNDTCATHRSRVPRRSFGRNKRREWRHWKTREDQAWIYFMFCVWQSSVRGCRFSVMFVYWLNVFKCSPVPASFFPYLSTSLHWCRSPGGRRDTLSESPRCWVGSRCWEDRAAGSGGDRQWLPEAVVLEQKKNRWDGRLAAVLLGRGGVAAVREGAEGVAPFRLEAEACCHPPCLGRSRERGTRCRLPSTGGATAVRQEADEHRARPPKEGPVPSHGTASEPLSWLRTERQCVREPDRVFFFPLSPLSSLSLLILRSPSLASSVLTPGTPRPPWRAPPGRGGEGGSRGVVSWVPPGLRGGDGGMWRVGGGREPWERSEAGGGEW